MANEVSRFQGLNDAWEKRLDINSELFYDTEPGWVTIEDGTRRPNLAMVLSNTFASLGLYQSTSDGLKESSDGGYFSVVGDNDTYASLYKNQNGEAVYISSLPSLGSIEGLDDYPLDDVFSTPDGIYQFALVDEQGRVVFAVDKLGQFYITPQETEDSVFVTPALANIALAEAAEDGDIIRTVDKWGFTDQKDSSMDASFFATPATAGVSWAFINGEGAILLAYGADGEQIGFDDDSTDDGNDSPDTTEQAGYYSGATPYLTDGALNVLHKGYITQPLTGEQDFNILSAYPLGADSVAAAVERDDYRSVSAVAIESTSGLMAPADPNVLRIVIVYGQSLSVGAHGLPLVSTGNPFPKNALMFDRDQGADIRMGLTTQGDPETLNPDELTGFTPILSKNGQGSDDRGETAGEATTYGLARFAQSVNSNIRILTFAPGLGGTAYSGLKKGTTPYSNMLAAVERAKSLANERGWTAIVDAVVMVHGEQDWHNTSYQDDLIQWQQDIEADVQSRTGQVAAVPFYLNQQSSFPNENAGYSSAVAVEQAASAYPDRFKLVCADYTFPYYRDYIHLLGPGYHYMGEYMQRAIIQDRWSGRSWSPLRMASATLNGATIVVEYDGCVGELVIDEDTVSNPGQWGFGIEADNDVTVTGVTTTSDNQLTLELSDTPTGDVMINYAINGAAKYSDKGADTIPRGNIRDRAGDTYKSTYDQRPLHNWAVHQQLTIGA